MKWIWDINKSNINEIILPSDGHCFIIIDVCSGWTQSCLPIHFLYEEELIAHEMEEITMAPIYIIIDQEKTGQNILHLMHRRGLRVKDIQDACGFEQPQAVYKWIHGQTLPSIDNLLILSKLLGSSVEGILATSEDAFPHLKKQRKRFFWIIIISGLIVIFK